MEVMFPDESKPNSASLGFSDIHVSSQNTNLLKGNQLTHTSDPIFWFSECSDAQKRDCLRQLVNMCPLSSISKLRSVLLPVREKEASHKRNNRAPTARRAGLRLLQNDHIFQIRNLCSGLISLTVNTALKNVDEITESKQKLLLDPFSYAMQKLIKSGDGNLLCSSYSFNSGRINAQNLSDDHTDFTRRPINDTSRASEILFEKRKQSICSRFQSLPNHHRFTFLIDLIEQSPTDILISLQSVMDAQLRLEQGIFCLPDNILSLIFSNLNWQSLTALLYVCKKFYRMLKNPTIWELVTYRMVYKGNLVNANGRRRQSPKLQWDQIKLEATKQHSRDWKFIYWKYFMSKDNRASVNKSSFLLETESDVKQPIYKERPTQHNTKRSHRSSISFNNRNEKKREKTPDDFAFENTCRRKSVTFTDLVIDDNTEAASDKLRPDENSVTSSSDSEIPGIEMLATHKKSVSAQLGDDEASSNTIREVKETQPDYYKQAIDLLADTQNQVEVETNPVTLPRPIRSALKLEGHMNSVLCLQAERHRLFTGSADRFIRIYDLHNGHCNRKLLGHKGGVRCLQYRNGWLVSGSWDTCCVVWDAVKLRQVCLLTGHTGSINDLNFNDKYLVTGSSDKTVRVWSMHTLSCRLTYQSHDKPITCVRLLSNVSQFVCGSADGAISLADVITGEMLCLLCEPTGNLKKPICLESSGALLISGHADGRICYFDMSQSSPENTVDKIQFLQAEILANPESAVNAMCYYGGKLFSAADNTISEWDVASMSCLRKFDCHTGTVRSIYVDDSFIISGADDNVIRVLKY